MDEILEPPGIPGIPNRTSGYELLLIPDRPTPYNGRIYGPYVYYDYAKRKILSLQSNNEVGEETNMADGCETGLIMNCGKHPGCCNIWACGEGPQEICASWGISVFRRIKWNRHVSGKVYFETLRQLDEYASFIYEKKS